MALDLFRVEGGLQIDGSIQILEGSGAPSADAPVGSTYHRTDAGGVYVKTTAGSGTDKWSLQAEKSYVDTQITTVTNMVNALGNAFNYVGTVAGGSQSTPYDLATLAAAGKDSGDYYKVSTAGWFVVGAGTAFYANAGDGLVWNNTGDVDKIDNTDSSVQGTAGYVSVTGSTDTGFTVDLDSTFKTTVANTASGLEAETSARIAGDNANASLINSETNSRIAADATLQANLDAEVTARIAGDAAEATARANADTTLQANIDAEAATRAAADATLTANLAAEVTARIAGDAAEATAREQADITLQANIDAVNTVVTTSGQVTTGNSVTSLTDSATGAVVAKWIVRVQETGTPANVNAYEVFATTDGVSTDFSRFSILKLGLAISGLNTNVAYSGGALQLTVSAGVNCDVIIKRVAVV